MSKSKIVIIEDNEMQSKIIADELLDEGFEVQRAYDGVMGLKLVQSSKIKPDLILIDIKLPQKSGLDVLKELKQSPETSKIKVIMMTTHDDREYRLKAAELKSDAMIIKSPRAISKIVDKVKELFASRL
jgi:DNA-binding response OmpR family regulator